MYLNPPPFFCTEDRTQPRACQADAYSAELNPQPLTPFLFPFFSFFSLLPMSLHLLSICRRLTSLIPVVFPFFYWYILDKYSDNIHH